MVATRGSNLLLCGPTLSNATKRVSILLFRWVYFVYGRKTGLNAAAANDPNAAHETPTNSAAETQANVNNAINTGTETQGTTNQPTNQRSRVVGVPVGVAGEHAAGVINPATPQVPC